MNDFRAKLKKDSPSLSGALYRNQVLLSNRNNKYQELRMNEGDGLVRKTHKLRAGGREEG